MTTAAAYAQPAPPLAGAPRCDAAGITCTGGAGWAVMSPAGRVLLYCSHCLLPHAPALEAAGYLVDPVFPG
jgi:hypothetical protein